MKANEKDKYANLHFVCKWRLINHINSQLGCKTALNYQITPVTISNSDESLFFQIKIPVLTYTNQQNTTDVYELIDSKIDTILEFFNSFEWDKHPSIYLWCWRTLKLIGVNTLEIAKINVDINDYTRSECINFNVPKQPLPSIREITMIDGTVIRSIVDPYMKGYGFFVDLSVPFSDMNFGWNYLHMYEHLMTHAWKGLSERDREDMNGSTMLHGVCYVYTTHHTMDSMMDYFKNYIKFHLESRHKKKWESLREGIELETQRTISETRDERSMVSIGRSDPSSYSFGYDTEVFRYYSSRPFSMLFVSNTEIDLNECRKLYESMMRPHEPVARPADISFDYIPLHVLRDKQDRQCYIVKYEYTDEIIDKILSPADTKLAYGIDCVAASTEHDLSVMNTLLVPFITMDIPLSKLKKYIRTEPLPMHANKFGLVTRTGSGYDSYSEITNEN